MLPLTCFPFHAQTVAIPPTTSATKMLREVEEEQRSTCWVPVCWTRRSRYPRISRQPWLFSCKDDILLRFCRFSCPSIACLPAAGCSWLQLVGKQMNGSTTAIKEAKVKRVQRKMVSKKSVFGYPMVFFLACHATGGQRKMQRKQTNQNATKQTQVITDGFRS